MGRQRPLLAIRQKTEDEGEANPEPLGFPALQMGPCQQGQRQPFLTPSAASREHKVETPSWIFL